MKKSLFKLQNVVAVVGLQMGMFSSVAQTRIYWTETQPSPRPFTAGPAFIMGANADGSNPVAVVSGAENVKGPNGLEYGNGFLYWPDQQLNAVMRVKPDGSELSMFASANNPYDVYPGPELAYVSFNNSNQIFSYQLDGAGAALAVPKSETTGPFAVDATSSNIYWSESGGSGRIRRSDLAGGNVTTLLTGTYSNDIQVSGDFIYICDNNFPAAIKRAKLDGTGLVSLIPLGFGTGIHVTQDAIYWSEFTTVNRADLNGNNRVTLYTSDPSSQLRGVVAIQTQEDRTPSVLADAHLVRGKLAFTVKAPAGKTVHVESASALTPGSWSEVATAVGAAAPVSVVAPFSPTTTAQFFRVRMD